MKAIAKYTWIGRTAARSNLAYAGEVVARTVFLTVVLYIFVRLWTVVYADANVERIAGFTLGQMLWYLVIAESIIMSAPRVSFEVDEDVRTGRLAVHLLKPLSYLLYRLSSTLGERAVRFTINLLAGALVAITFVGSIQITPQAIAMTMIALPLAFVLDFLASFMVGLGAFWLESTTGLWLIYTRLNLILGGTILPIDIFPESIQQVMRLLPFSSIVYGPARILVSSDEMFFSEIIARQLVALIILAAALAALQRMALRRLHANGG
jgi:ABC-2 type transport system permease protein